MKTKWRNFRGSCRFCLTFFKDFAFTYKKSCARSKAVFPDVIVAGAAQREWKCTDLLFKRKQLTCTMWVASVDTHDDGRVET